MTGMAPRALGWILLALPLVIIACDRAAHWFRREFGDLRSLRSAQRSRRALRKVR